MLNHRLRTVLPAVLTQTACIQLAVLNVDVDFQSIARAAFRTHCLDFIEDVEKNPWVRRPQRHRRIRAIRREIAGEENHHLCAGRNHGRLLHLSGQLTH
jgi:hypothetical protein